MEKDKSSKEQEPSVKSEASTSVDGEILIKAKKPKSWIQRLKEESWNAELLITTLSIFAAIKLMDLLDWLTTVFIDIVDPSQYLIGHLILMLSFMGVCMMISMFVIHFFLRAYWVGLLGLNSVFPDYGSTPDSFYGPLYTEKLIARIPKIKDSIGKIDELCSVIFSIAFSLLFVYIYMGILASIYLLLFNLLSPYLPSTILFIPVYIFLVINILASLFLLIGKSRKFKEHDTFQTWSVNFGMLIGYLFLGPFTKPISQVAVVFSSNVKRKKNMMKMIMLFLMLGLFGSIFVIFNSNVNYTLDKNYYFSSIKAHPAYYASENAEIDFLLCPEIESDIVKSDVVRLFIPVYSHEDKYRESICGPIYQSAFSSPSDRKKAKLDCYSDVHKISLNGVELDLDFLEYTHPKTEQGGIITYIPLKGVEEGQQELIIRKEMGEEYEREWSIPFYLVD